MGLFDKIKEVGENFQQASQAISNTQVTVTVTNPSITVGDTVQGNINITSQQALNFKGIKLRLMRHLKNETLPDRDQWIFNEEYISSPMQLQPTQAENIPFSFVVGDGLKHNLDDDLNKSGFAIIGMNPDVLPKKGATFEYDHFVSALLEIDGLPTGPFGTCNVTFTYPNINIGGEKTESY